MGLGPIEHLVSLLAPPLCAACGEQCPPDALLCERCASHLAGTPAVIEPGPPGVDLAVAASPFDGVARRVVHGLKYSRRLALAGVAAEAMLRALPRYVYAGPGSCEGAPQSATRFVSEEPAMVVVPVPPGAWRWRWRGFDPAEEIALAVSARAGLPLTRCLRRDGGRRQVGRRRWERLSDPPEVLLSGEPPERALLVDDVWTTGATLSACGRALRAGGSRRVTALALARAL
jgi:predicted amidophosphoribosyltransferase